MEIIISIIAVVISYMAYRKSVAANMLSEKANKIAEEANELVKNGMEYSNKKDKQKLIDEITTRVTDNWSKNGGPQAILMSECKIHNNRELTLEDFNTIWNAAYQRVKKRTPDKSFQELLKENN